MTVRRKFSLKRIRVYQHDMATTIARLEDEIQRGFDTISEASESRVTSTTSSVAASDGDIIAFGTLSAIASVTLPATPSDGYSVRVKAAPNSTDYNVTVDGNGNTIDSSSTFTMDVDHMAADFVFVGGEWRVF